MSGQQLSSRGNLGVSALSLISVTGFFAVVFSGVGGELTENASFAATTQSVIANSTVWITLLIVSSHATRVSLLAGNGGRHGGRHRRLVGFSSAAVVVASFTASMFGVLAFLSEFTSWGGIVGSFGQFLLYAALAALAVWAMVASAENTLKAFDVSVSISLNKFSAGEDNSGERTTITVDADRFTDGDEADGATTEQSASSDNEAKIETPDEHGAGEHEERDGDEGPDT